MMRGRRETFLLAGAAVLSTFMVNRASGNSSIIAGAIRWDAWEAAGSDITRAVEVTLGEHIYHERAPFCAKPLAADAISFSGCDLQSSMDEEIYYANTAGLNYWAYCWYGFENPMTNAWALHQSSVHRDRINWCFLLQFSRLGGESVFVSAIPAYIRCFKQSNYQKLQDGRPLLYIYIDQPEHLAADWQNDWANLRTALNRLAAAGTQAGLSKPYIVIMHGKPAIAKSIMVQLAADAISNYIGPVPKGTSVEFTELAKSVQKYWTKQAATQAEIVPICMTGWDTRPRQRNPPPWQHQKPAADDHDFVAAGTPSQISAHIQAAIKYIYAQPVICPSRILLIYSWDECDEGGSPLIPTYSDDGPDHKILDAVAAVLSANN